MATYKAMQITRPGTLEYLPSLNHSEWDGPGEKSIWLKQAC